MSHRDPAAPVARPWWHPGRWCTRRRQHVHLPDYLWPLVVRTAHTQRMTPEAWVQQVAAAAASAQVLAQQPPRDGQQWHPQQWRQALALLGQAADEHWQLVHNGTVIDLDGRFTSGDPEQARREQAGARPRRARPRPVSWPPGE